MAAAAAPTTEKASLMLEAHQSIRFSSYSMAPSLNFSIQTNDSAHAEIREIKSKVDRMENKALSSQRVHLSEEKTEIFNKLALGARLERALDRRMSGQDAVMRPRRDSSPVDDLLSEKAE
ncbi:hypothetical protein ESCO_001865 [Escovopsis weberi]|uniref:Uncharacterized protein n=1 Tax=Escovopsis weberi TaxID=150374 RepID=A0A0M9VWD5_ESCWE|nr:hypothetical protein ESCO_001865 [Escovopsis weberi]